jgi:hypothetical protein
VAEIDRKNARQKFILRKFARRDMPTETFAPSGHARKPLRVRVKRLEAPRLLPATTHKIKQRRGI